MSEPESFDGGNPTALRVDAPLAHPSQDRLGRSPFARALADAIADIPAEESFVFGLQGPWGAGKTSVINFVLAYLRESEGEAPPILPVQFNPWWFSGTEDLLRQFFAQILAALNEQSKGDKYESLVEHLRLFSALLSPAEFIPAVSVPAQLLKGAVDWSSEKFGVAAERERDIHKIRDNIDQILLSESIRLLIVIDDLDRCSGKEIRQMMQLVKAIADFPNTIYLLAYEHSAVSSALSVPSQNRGEEFLAKIVQAPFDLPPCNKISLRRLLVEELNALIADTPDELFDNRQWQNIFYDGLEALLTTPRDLTRFLNAVRATYPAVRDEVEAADFLGIQALRVFAPDFHREVANSKTLLTGTVRAGQEARDRLREGYDELSRLLPEESKQPIREVMGRLFPRWSFAYGGAAYGSDWSSRWRRNRRICSEDYFDLYFQLTIPEGGFSRGELEALIDAGEDPAQLAEELTRLANISTADGISRARLFLEELEDYTEDMARDRAANIVRALYMAGDEILGHQKDYGFFGFPDTVQMSRITYRLLRKFPSADARYEVIRTALEESTSIAVPVSEIKIYEQGLEKEGDPGPDSSSILSRAHLEELKPRLIERIREHIHNGTIFTVPNSVALLYRFVEWSDREREAHEAIQELLEDPRHFVTFVVRSRRTVKSVVAGERAVESRQETDAESLAEISGFSQAEILERAREVLSEAPDWLDSESEEALEELCGEGVTPDG